MLFMLLVRKRTLSDILKTSKIQFLFVRNETLEPENEFSRDAEDLLGVVLLRHLVEELDDVRKVHVAV